MRPRGRSENTGEDTIKDEKRDGYVVDPHGKIRGEVRNYDPYSRFGEIMLYEIDSFGFVSGYVSGNWDVMSEEDILADSKLASRFVEVKYQIWMRQNIDNLQATYHESKIREDFDRFCRKMFRKSK